MGDRNMTTKKRAKAKTKAKTEKKSVKKKSVKSRPVAGRARKKKPAARPKARAAKPKAAARTKPATLKAGPPAPPAMSIDEEHVGVVIHYYSHLSVAIIQMERGTLRVGDSVHIKGHTTDFQQPVGSMEIDHVHVTNVVAQQIFGLRVSDHVREHDVVFKVASP